MNTLNQKNSTIAQDFHFNEQSDAIQTNTFSCGIEVNSIFTTKYQDMDDPNDKPKTNDEDIITNDEEEDIITNDQENFNPNSDINDEDPLKHLKVL